MSILFTYLTEVLPYPAEFRAQLSSIHSEIIEDACKNYDGTFKYRRSAINKINTASYHVLNRDKSWIDSWNVSDTNFIPEDVCKAYLGRLHVSEKEVNWDIAVPATSVRKLITDVKSADVVVQDVPVFVETSKQDLYIQPPTVPQFDVNSVVVSQQIGDCIYCIYESLPKVPSKQCEISTTTDVSLMSDKDLMNLYPNVFIRTRSEALYKYVDGLKYHDQLGLILPISGFTEDEIIDNIVRYPHLYKLMKYIDGTPCSFYSTLEIDGKLYKVSDVWSSLPESSIIPYVVDYVKEYVVRRYLLERDIKGIDHSYKLVGSLDPFLTLFMPESEYARYGYHDAIDLAKKCVESRINYKKSRNPILRRMSDV